jgi:hypothetical protein
MTSLLNLMHNFQKLNKVNKQCITNTQYFYDNFIMNYPTLPIHAMAVICLVGTRTIIHMVIMINDTIYDPSYEIHSLNDVLYFNNIKDYMNNITIDSRNKIGKLVVKEFIEFIEIAKLINNKKHIIADNKYYHSQADYVLNNIDSKKILYSS